MNWISVEDEMPPVDEMVLICWAGEDIEPEKDYITAFGDDCFEVWANYNNGDEPTHWMPLPKPPL